MTSFTLFGSSTTAQTLASGETGYVGPNAALVTTGDAINTVGSFGLTILGSVSAQAATAIDIEAVASPPDNDVMNLTVGMAGQVTSLTNSAIVAQVSHADLTLSNHGLISGGSVGIRLLNYYGISTGEVRMFNAGTIVGLGGSGVLYTSPGLGCSIVNSGTIATGVAGLDAIKALGTGSVLQNSGSILGGVVMGTGALVVNSGLIDGNVNFGNGADEFINSGGRVTGTVNGLSGDDIYRIDRADIAIADTAGNDTIYSSVSYDIVAGIEALILTGTADIRANGDAAANTLGGNSGDNRISGLRGADALSGGNGDDTMQGGAGNDTLAFDAGDDVVNGGTGTDTYDLTGATDAALVNLGTGMATGDGTDTDTLTGIENVQGGSGADTVIGAAGANELRGGASNDSLSGGSDADTLNGQSGADTLFGGSGTDVFLFDRLSDSTDLKPDRIADFRTTQNDLIDLSLIDANGLLAGNGAFLFSGAAFFAEGVASVRVTQDVAGSLTFVEARDNVGAAVDLRIILTGLQTLTAGDFVL